MVPEVNGADVAAHKGIIANPSNDAEATCGECHPNISEKMASTPIHGVGGQGLRTPIADVVEKIYIVAIAVIIVGAIAAAVWTIVEDGRRTSRSACRRVRAPDRNRTCTFGFHLRKYIWCA